MLENQGCHGGRTHTKWLFVDLCGSEVSAMLEGWPVGFHAVSMMVLVRHSLASLRHGNHSTDFPFAWYAGPQYSSMNGAAGIPAASLTFSFLYQRCLIICRITY